MNEEQATKLILAVRELASTVWISALILVGAVVAGLLFTPEITVTLKDDKRGRS